MSNPSQIECLALGLLTTGLRVGEKLSFQEPKLQLPQGPGLAQHVPGRQGTMVLLHISRFQRKAPGQPGPQQ